MRQLFAVALVLTLGHQAAAVLSGSQPEIWITVKHSQVAGGSAAVRVVRSEIYVDGPSAGVGIPLSAGKQPELMFSIRGWKEGDKARVVVSARLEDKRAPDGATETPIATFVIAPGQSIDVRETEKWGAPPLVVSAALR